VSRLLVEFFVSRCCVSFFIYKTIFRERLLLEQSFETSLAYVPLGVKERHVPVSVTTPFLPKTTFYCAL
jgi:hypothetical protein